MQEFSLYLKKKRLLGVENGNKFFPVFKESLKIKFKSHL